MNRIDRWHYSLAMLLTYVSVFVLWKAYPSRASFLGIGGLAVFGLMAMGRQMIRSGYFANRVDLTLHGLVVADLIIETTIFEVFRLFQPHAVVSEFHNNMNFIGCTLAFATLIGLHRFVALRRKSSKALGPVVTSSAAR